MLFLILSVGILTVVLLFVGEIISGISPVQDYTPIIFSNILGFGIYDDYPEYNLNKSNIADAINYNPPIQTLLRDYNNIGFQIGFDAYTLHLFNGRFVDITRGIDPDTNFTVHTNQDTFTAMVNDARHRDIAHLLLLLMQTDTPETLKQKAIEQAKQSIYYKK